MEVLKRGQNGSQGHRKRPQGVHRKYLAGHIVGGTKQYQQQQLQHQSPTRLDQQKQILRLSNSTHCAASCRLSAVLVATVSISAIPNVMAASGVAKTGQDSEFVKFHMDLSPMSIAVSPSGLIVTALSALQASQWFGRLAVHDSTGALLANTDTADSATCVTWIKDEYLAVSMDNGDVAVSAVQLASPLLAGLPSHLTGLPHGWQHSKARTTPQVGAVLHTAGA